MMHWYIRNNLTSLLANRDFRLTKATGWDSVALERVAESTKEGRGAELGAVVCGEGELTARVPTAALQLGLLIRRQWTLMLHQVLPLFVCSPSI